MVSFIWLKKTKLIDLIELYKNVLKIFKKCEFYVN